MNRKLQILAHHYTLPTKIMDGCDKRTNSLHYGALNSFAKQYVSHLLPLEMKMSKLDQKNSLRCLQSLLSRSWL